MSETVIEGSTQVSPSSPKKKGWIAAGIAVIVVLGAVAGLMSRGTGAVTVPPSDVYQVKAMPQVSNISTSGTVAASSEINMAFQNVGGTVKTINVHVGDHVKAGQVLATLDASTLQAQVQQAQAGVSQAQGQLAQAQAQLALVQQGATAANIAVAKAGLNAAKTALANAQKQYQDAQAAYNNRSAQQAQLTQAQAAAAQAQTAYDTAQQQQQSAISTAQRALQTAQNNLQTDEQNLQTDQAQYGSITSAQVQQEYQKYQQELSYYNSWQNGGFAGTNPYTAAMQTAQQVYQNDYTNYEKLVQDKDAVQGDKAAVAKAQDALTQAQTSVSTAKAAYTAAQNNLAAAQANYNNRTQEQQQLDAAANAVKQEQSAVQQAQAQLGQVQQPATPAQIQQAQAGVQTAQAGVQAAQAQLQTAQVNASYAVLKAPVDGIITQKNNSVGDVVSPGQPVFVLDVPHLQVDLSVSDTQLPYVKVGEPVTMTVSALPGKTFKGQIFEVDPTPIPGNGNEYKVKATLNDPSNTLKPGMSGNVTIETGHTGQNSLSIPTMSLQTINGVQGVFVMGKNPVKTSGASSSSSHSSSTANTSNNPGSSSSGSGATSASQVPNQVDQNLPSGVYFQPVQVALQGSQTVEVTSGLKAGQKILLGVGRFVANPGSNS